MNRLKEPLGCLFAGLIVLVVHPVGFLLHVCVSGGK